MISAMKYKARFISLYYYLKIFEFNRWGIRLTLKRRKVYSDKSERMKMINKGLATGEVGELYGVEFHTTFRLLDQL
jgi:hypothetical protein